MPTDPKAIGFINVHPSKVFLSQVMCGMFKKKKEKGQEGGGGGGGGIVYKFHYFIFMHIQYLLKQCISRIYRSGTNLLCKPLMVLQKT